MSPTPLQARACLTGRTGTGDTDPALERGLEALAFLERSRELAAEPVVPSPRLCPSDRPPGA